MNKKIKVRMLSLSDIVKGQGVSSAFHEQVNLVSNSKMLEIKINQKFKDADIVHHHTVDPKNYFTMFKKKYSHVAYVHMLAEKLEGSIKLNPIIYKIFQKYTHSFYRKADHLVIVNPNTKELLLSYGIAEDKIHYIPNYVSEEQFFVVDEKMRDAYKDKYEFSKTKKTVLAVGQVLLGKGVEDFIKSAINNPSIDYVWAGGFSFGKLTDGYDQLKEYFDNPPKNVRFLGVVERDLMNEVYNAADILFMPSYNEMFPMTILEAINTNKPLVIRDLSLYEDILFDHYRPCAGLVDFDDEINQLVSDDQYFLNSVEKSIVLKNYYSKPYILNMWEEFYQHVVDQKEGE